MLDFMQHVLNSEMVTSITFTREAILYTLLIFIFTYFYAGRCVVLQTMLPLKYWTRRDTASKWIFGLLAALCKYKNTDIVLCYPGT